MPPPRPWIIGGHKRHYMDGPLTPRYTLAKAADGPTVPSPGSVVMTVKGSKGRPVMQRPGLGREAPGREVQHQQGPVGNKEKAAD